MSAVWLTWERQQRNRSLAHKLGLPLFEIRYSGNRLKRYIQSMWRTAKSLHYTRPEIVFFQNPSVVLGCWLIILQRIWPNYKFKLVGDFHNAAIQGPFTFLNRLIARECEMVIVSNDRLGQILVAWGADPFSLPDPLPELASLDSKGGDPTTFVVVFVCSWAADEPVENVLAAAEMLCDIPDVRIVVTGRPRQERLAQRVPPNVILAGFLPEEEFHAALAEADVIMDLTTREDCMVCGGYEGLSLDKPLILSRNEPTVSWFGDAGVYCDNRARSIEQAIRTAREDIGLLKINAAKQRELVQQRTDCLIAQLRDRLPEIAVRAARG